MRIILILISFSLTSPLYSSDLVRCVSRALSSDVFHVAIITELSVDTRTNEVLSGKMSFVSRRTEINGASTYTLYYKLNQSQQEFPTYLLQYEDILALRDPPDVKPLEKNWVSSLHPDDLHWLVFMKVEGDPPYDPKKSYPFEIYNELCGAFQIKDDPLDNRLNTDLELLYEDLSLMVEHRPNWADVPMDDLKTDFGKQVLEHLLEEPDPAPQESPQP